MKAARPETDGSLKALLARIERLERGLGPAHPTGEPAHPTGEPAVPHPADDLLAVAVAEQPSAAQPPPAAPAPPPVSEEPARVDNGRQRGRRRTPRAPARRRKGRCPKPRLGCAHDVRHNPRALISTRCGRPWLSWWGPRTAAERRVEGRAGSGVERRGADRGVRRDGVVPEEESRGQRPPGDGDRGAAPAHRAATAAGGVRAARGAAPTRGGRCRAGTQQRRGVGGTFQG